MVVTGLVDEFFDYAQGALPYRSIRFERRTTRTTAHVQCATVENFPKPASQPPYTRSTEFASLTGQTGLEHST